jgi:hypothetical protein
VQQMIRADGGSGNYIETTPPMLGIWNTLLDGSADATWVSTCAHNRCNTRAVAITLTMVRLLNQRQLQGCCRCVCGLVCRIPSLQVLAGTVSSVGGRSRPRLLPPVLRNTMSCAVQRFQIVYAGVCALGVFDSAARHPSNMTKVTRSCWCCIRKEYKKGV